MHPQESEALPIPGADRIRDILVQRVDRQKQAVGIVAGVIEPNGRRVAAHGRLAQGDPRTLDGDTIFEIGSVTKIFTALLLADMVHHGEAALDDPAARYLPEGVTLPERNGKAITLLDLATHRSGLPPVPTNLQPRDARNPYAGYSIDDLYEFLSGYALPQDPGAAFAYSNLGAGLLGHLLARRAGTDYERLVRSRITEPLGMPDTGIALTPSMQRRMATGHNPALEPAMLWDLPTLAGAGALRSSAHDMLTFLEAFLGYRDSPLAPAMRAMVALRRPAGPMEMGLGWFFLGDIVWHNGGTGGFRSFLGCHLKARKGVIVLSNAFTLAGVDDIGGHLLNPKLPLSDPQPPDQPKGMALDPQVLDRYTGRYQGEPNRILEITREGDRLFVQVTQAADPPVVGPRFAISAESETSFFVPMTGSRIVFETGPEGPATGLTMRRAGRDPVPAARLP